MSESFLQTWELRVVPSQVSLKPGILPLALAGAAGVIVLLLAIFFARFL